MPFPQRSRKTPPDTRPWRRVHPFPIHLSLGLTILFTPSLAQATGDGVSVLTFHGGNARLGWNARETKLMPINVVPATFGKLWNAPLDGHVNGSPLYVAGFDLGGGKKADVVFAATEANSIFALNAADGSILWATRNVTPTLTSGQFNGSWRNPERHGILSTPVIDLQARALYICAPVAKGLRQVFQAWAFDLRTGKILPGWPVMLKGEYKGTPFTAGQQMQRGALLLQDGWLYIPFGGRGDIPPWRGWVMGVNTKKPNAPQRAFCASPETDGGGIWSAGGVSATPNGDLFAVTGNGAYDFPAGDNLAQTVVRLRADQKALTFSKKPSDWYTPENHQFLDDQDEDLGGATAVVLPDQPDTSTPHLLFTGGKDGCAYLLNRDNLGGLGSELQRVRYFCDPKATYHEGIRATCAYFDAGSAGRFLFVPGDNPGPDNNLGMVALKLAPEKPGGPMRFAKVWTLKRQVNRPSSPVVSSAGSKNGIVWIVEPEADGDFSGTSALLAYNALTGEELYSSAGDTPTDRLIGGRKFTSVTVADGRVLIGAQGVFCYGLTTEKAAVAATEKKP